jgi:hypothetical protein
LIVDLDRPAESALNSPRSFELHCRMLKLDTKTGMRHAVDTEVHKCICLEWQHTWKACEHSILFMSSEPKYNVHTY